MLRPATGIDDRTLLHAGPPFDDPADVVAPVRRSLELACMFEGWADSPDAAWRSIDEGEVTLAAAQDHRVVVPLAGVASPSMAVAVVVDENGQVPAVHPVLNEGVPHATRLGRADPEVPAHLRWLREALAPWLQSCLADPLELFSPLRDSLTAGDDGHGMTARGSHLIHAELKRRGSKAPDDVDTFMTNCPPFALNLWMGAVLLALSAADGINGSSVVTRIGGNGRRFGVQVAGDPGHWHTAPAPSPRGPLDQGHQGRRSVGAIGDSALVDAFGLGAMAWPRIGGAPARLDHYLPADAGTRPERLLVGTHPVLGHAAILDAAHVCAVAAGPVVSLGMIDETGEAGRLGGGVLDAPTEPFCAAVSAAA
jgi:hypothetical protein